MVKVIDKENIRYSVKSGCATLACSDPENSIVVIPSYVEEFPVKTIGAASFWPSKAEKIIIPDTVTEICSSAFYECRKLKEINLPKTLNVIRDHAFSCCESLESVTIPGNVCLSNNIFSGCNGLKTVIIEESQKSLPAEIFSFCGIKNLYLPDSMTEISTGAFFGVSKEMVVHCNKGTFAEEWAMEHNFKINYNKTQLNVFLEEITNSHDTNIVK